MIGFGFSLQNKDDHVPKIVADWVSHRNAAYPDVLFEIDHVETHPTKRAEYDPLVKKYSRFFSTGGRPGLGILSVTFPYLAENWYVRIIGSLTSEQRQAVANLPNDSELDQLNKGSFGKKRTPAEPVLERATDLMPLQPDERKTSAFSTTGDAIHESDRSFKVAPYNDPSIKNDAPLMTLLAETKDPFALNALAFKIHAAAALRESGALPSEKEGGRMSFGQQVPFGEKFIRIDILDEFDNGSVIAIRCLATNERLHDEEKDFWEAIAQHHMTKKVIFAVQLQLHPLDAAFIKLLQRDRANVEEVVISNENA